MCACVCLANMTCTKLKQNGQTGKDTVYICGPSQTSQAKKRNCCLIPGYTQLPAKIFLSFALSPEHVDFVYQPKV